MIIAVRIPGSAVNHVLEVNGNGHEWGALNAVLEAGRIEKHGPHHSVIVDFPSRELAEEARDRLEDLAEVERQVAAYGDDADHSIKRACDTGASRIQEALS